VPLINAFNVSFKNNLCYKVQYQEEIA